MNTQSKLIKRQQHLLYWRETLREWRVNAKYWIVEIYYSNPLSVFDSISKKVLKTIIAGQGATK